jgi:hypothetical protein
MKKNKYKVGDKVRLKSTDISGGDFEEIFSGIGTVVRVPNNSIETSIEVDYGHGGYRLLAHYNYFKLALKPNEQLLFNFMED